MRRKNDSKQGSDRSGSPRTNCPLCGSSSLDEIYEAFPVPVFANVLWSDSDRAINCPKGDIRLAVCRECSFIFNTVFDPALLEYSERYENTLHYSPHFQEYARALTQRLIERYDLHGREIVEIGCGKGDFLLMLCRLGGNRGIGFDPSYEDRPEGDTDGLDVRFIRDNFGERYAPVTADLVYSRHVLEHVPAPQAFLRTIRSAIGEREDTAIFFEVPNALHTIRHTFIWDIIYEHCSYFTPGTLAYLFAMTGFEVEETEEVYDGQFCAIHALPASRAVRPPETVSAVSGTVFDEVTSFADAYRGVIDRWREDVHAMARDGKRVVVWGAGSKGVTFLNLIRAEGAVRYAVDLNPRKEGMFIAGSGQRIVPPGFLREYRPDIVIVMNALYEREIREVVAGLGISPRFIRV